MAVIYTTVALVKKRTKTISAELTNPDIEECINEAESIIDSTMKKSFLGSFDMDKHGIIRQCCTDLAAFLCVIYDPVITFKSLGDAEMTINLLWNSAERSLSLLSDSRTVDFIS